MSESYFLLARPGKRRTQQSRERVFPDVFARKKKKEKQRKLDSHFLMARPGKKRTWQNNIEVDGGKL
jgi:hypothetical protein